MKRILFIALLLIALLPGVGHTVQLGTEDCAGSAGNLGANWTVVTTQEMPQLSGGGLCQPKTLNVNAMALYTAVAWPPDQWAQFKIVTATQTTRIPAIILRGTTAARTGYECTVTGPLNSTATMNIYRMNAATPTLLGTSGATTVSTGDTIYCEVVGSNLTMKKNGVPMVGPVSNGVIGSGSAGFGLFSQATAVTNTQIGDWAGGSIDAAATQSFLDLMEVLE